MNELRIIQDAKNQFITCAINRYAIGENGVHQFRLALATFGRERARGAFIRDVEQAFSSFGLEAQYDEFIREFIITVPLGNCIFSPSEAEHFNCAQSQRYQDGRDM